MESPADRKPNTVSTVILVPRNTGFPLQIAGSMEITSSITLPCSVGVPSSIWDMPLYKANKDARFRTSLESKCGAAHRANGLDELVHQILEHFLATGFEARLAVGEGVCADFLHRDLLAGDLRADAAGPALVAIVDEVLQASVLADGGGNFQAACEGVHAADVGVEKVGRVMGLAAALRIEVEAAGGEAAHFQHLEHDLGGEINVGRKLVGIPADEFIALVRIHGAERAGIDGHSHLVEHRVPGEGRVVGFQVQLEVIHQAILAEEIQARCGVRVVLVRSGLARLRLDVKLASEADLFRVVHGEVEQVREVIEFALHVGIKEGGVTLATTPEGVAFTAKLESAVHGCFHLSCAVGECIGVRRGAGTLRVTRVGEQASGAPEQLFTSRFLEIEQMVSDLLEGGVGFRQVAELRCDVAVVPAVVVDAGLIEELEEDIGALEGVVHGIALVIPWHQRSRASEGVGKTVAHHVPVGGGEAGVLLHRLTRDDFVRVVLLEGVGVLGFGSFELNFWDIGKIRHGRGLLVRNGGGKCEKTTISRTRG